MENRSKRTIKPPTRFVDEIMPTALTSTPPPSTPRETPQSSKQQKVKLPTPGETLKIKLPAFRPKRPPSLVTTATPIQEKAPSPVEPTSPKAQAVVKAPHTIPKATQQVTPKGIQTPLLTPKTPPPTPKTPSSASKSQPCSTKSQSETKSSKSQPSASKTPAGPTKVQPGPAKKPTLKLSSPRQAASPEKPKPSQIIIERIPIDALPKPARPRTPPQFQDIAPNTVLPFWDARTAAEEHEDDNVKELVHCKCDLIEESGLMVQCETCLTWQHGNCLNIFSEEEVPDGYTCFACANPKLPRESQRYAYNQEWLIKGKLKCFDKNDDCKAQNFKDSLSKINKIADLALEVSKVIGSLKAQVKILDSATEEPELKYWKRSWLDESGNDVIPSGVPMADYDAETCRENLRTHIGILTKQVETRLNNIETRVTEIERELAIIHDESNNDISEIRNKLNQLIAQISTAMSAVEPRPLSQPNSHSDVVSQIL